MTTWTPSKRASELIGAMWDAFEAGDKWVYVTHPSTARYTGESLVWNGIGEWQTDSAGRRIRLSDETLALNGYPTRDWQQYRDDMAELEAEDEATCLVPTGC